MLRLQRVEAACGWFSPSVATWISYLRSHSSGFRPKNVCVSGRKTRKDSSHLQSAARRKQADDVQRMTVDDATGMKMTV
eukprot:1599665-Rhodomonas_salina.5